MKLYLILLFSLIFCSQSFFKLNGIVSEYNEQEAQEALYLPRKTALKGISFNYKNVVAHILWFNTVNYFGKHYRGDKNYHWLSKMCELTTTTNPNMEHVFEFCALMLAWEANQPWEADTILKDFHEAHPGKWRPLYLRAMNSIIFFKNTKKAKEYLIKATQLDNSPAFLARLLSMEIARLENEQTAIAFLKSMLAKSSDLNQRKSLKAKIKKLKKSLKEKKKNESP